MLDLIYSLPTWLLGVIIVGAAALIPGAGLYVVHRRVPIEVRHVHNEVAGFISAIVGVVYAVLLAFLAISVWEEFGKAESTTQLEANAISDVFHGADAYPEPLRSRVRQAVRVYLDTVIGEEWKLHARGMVSDAAWQTLGALHRDMLDFRPRDAREQVVHAEELRSMNAALDQRRNRIYLAGSGVHPLVWGVLLTGSLFVVAFALFFGTVNFRAHLAMTMILGASIGLVFFLIVALDYPFRGGIGIHPDAFARVRGDLRRVSGE